MNNKKRRIKDEDKFSEQDLQKMKYKKERKEKEASKSWSVLTQLNNLS